jgi:hypothetical protein
MVKLGLSNSRVILTRLVRRVTPSQECISFCFFCVGEHVTHISSVVDFYWIKYLLHLLHRWELNKVVCIDIYWECFLLQFWGDSNCNPIDDTYIPCYRKVILCCILTKCGYGVQSNNQCCQLWYSKFVTNKYLLAGACWTPILGLSNISHMTCMSVFPHAELLILRDRVKLVEIIVT